MSVPGTLPITGPLAPTDTLDTYPTHFSIYGNGGFVEVADVTARDAITADRRHAGMWVYTIATDAVYVLGADLTTWTAKSFSTPGRSVYWDSGAPSGGLGNDNDTYINNDNGDRYTKTGGVWLLGTPFMITYRNIIGLGL